MCDIGRIDYKLVERSDRLMRPVIRMDEVLNELPWDKALAQATNQLKELIGRYGEDSVGFVISSDATNEEAFALAKLATETGAAHNLRLLAGKRAERVEFAGGFVIESDRSPNERGVFDILSRFLPSAAVEAVTDMRSLAGKKGLYVLCGPHSDAERIGALAEAARKAKLVVVQATLPSALTEAAAIVFPGATYAEKDGTLTNSRGLVQLIRPAFAPPREARADLAILLQFCDAMGIATRFRTAGEAAAEIARELRGYPSHEQIGETGWKMASSGAGLPAKGGEP